MDYRRFRNLNESFAAKETSKGMSFAEALDELDFEEVEDIKECAEEPIEEVVEAAAVEEVTNELTETVDDSEDESDTAGELTPAELLSTALGYKGYQLVATARDGEEVIILAKQDPIGLLDCAVEDLDLEDVDAVIAYIDEQPEVEVEAEDAE